MPPHPPRHPSRLARWLIYFGLTLSGCVGYGCAVSCNRLKAPASPPGVLVAQPRPAAGWLG